MTLDAMPAVLSTKLRLNLALVEIDDVSLDAFARNDVLCRTLDTAMAEWEHMGQEDADDLHSYVDYLRHAGLTSIEDLRRELRKEKDVILCQFKKRTTQEGGAGPNLERGICLLHLVQVILARRGIGPLSDFFTKFGFGADDETSDQVLTGISECSGGR